MGQLLGRMLGRRFCRSLLPLASRSISLWCRRRHSWHGFQATSSRNAPSRCSRSGLQRKRCGVQGGRADAHIPTAHIIADETVAWGGGSGPWSWPWPTPPGPCSTPRPGVSCMRECGRACRCTGDDEHLWTLVDPTLVGVGGRLRAGVRGVTAPPRFSRRVRCRGRHVEFPSGLLHCREGHLAALCGGQGRHPSVHVGQFRLVGNRRVGSPARRNSLVGRTCRKPKGGPSGVSWPRLPLVAPFPDSTRTERLLLCER